MNEVLPEHKAFRSVVRRFVENEIAPYNEQWEREGVVPRAIWKKAGEAGLLCTTMPEAYGGAGDDFRSAIIIVEELVRAGAAGPGFSLHSNIVAPYILHYGTEEARGRWLPAFAAGEAIGAIAMTEPQAGSDLAAIRTHAVRDGEGYRISGSKTFVSNGQLADAVIVVAKTDPNRGAKGVSLFVVDAAAEGFARGRNLDKVGMHAQDTSELFFHDVYVDQSAVLGDENRGFAYLMNELPQERLLIAAGAVASAHACFESTVRYVKDRTAFGQRIADFQNTRFVLADISTEIEVARAFLDDCIRLNIEGALTAERAAMAKLWCSEMQGRAIDACLQLHGGYGYMHEYSISRAWLDARVSRIYGGSSEIMREVIGRAAVGG